MIKTDTNNPQLEQPEQIFITFSEMAKMNRTDLLKLLKINGVIYIFVLNSPPLKLTMSQLS